MTSSRCVLRIAIVLSAWTAPGVAGEVILADGFDFGFRIETPELAVGPGAEAAFCYYFRVPGDAGDAAIGIRRWSSRFLDTGIRRMTLFAPYEAGQPVELEPPGSLVVGNCWVDPGVGVGGIRTEWVYSTQERASRLAFPADDGAGLPLAAKLQPGQPVYLHIAVANDSAEPVSALALLDAETLGSGAAFTPSAPYVFIKAPFSLPPFATTAVTTTCATPADARFWHLTTQTRRFATLAEVKDGANVLVVTTDWEHPAVAEFGAPDFLQFSPAGVTLACTYANTGGGMIESGDSELNDELCLGVGYYFPAERSRYCIDGIGPL